MAGIQFSGLASGLDTDSIVKDLMKVQRIRVDKVDKEKMALEMKKEVWAEMNTKIYSFYTGQVSSLKSSGLYRAKSANVSNESALGVTATSAAMRGAYTIKVDQLAKGARLYSKEIGDTTVKTSEGISFTLSDGETSETITLESGSGVQELRSAINKSGLNINANFDANTGRIFLDSKNSGEGASISFSDIDTPAEQEFMEALGFFVNASGEINEEEAVFYQHTDGSLLDQVAYDALVDKTGYDVNPIVLGSKGQDAIYQYNGLELKAASNEVSINGLNLVLKNVSAENITVNVTQDTEGIYDKVKEFVNAYNELMAEINTKLDADSAGDYEPLTAEEKESLDETTIKLWETKVKDSLLRKDRTLSTLASSMRNILTGSFGVDLTELPEGFRHLSDLGIVTGEYTEKGKLHIQGDPDDPAYALREDKLRVAIEEDPEKVADFLKGIGESLHSMMNEKMRSSTISSALTFYNDKTINKQVSTYESRIADLEDYNASVESRYYRQFIAMEKAIQKMNSQSSYFSSMMGGAQ